eukprot:11157774-Lingulodinium_polyedra.AAC.1
MQLPLPINCHLTNSALTNARHFNALGSAIASGPHWSKSCATHLLHLQTWSGPEKTNENKRKGNSWH